MWLILHVTGFVCLDKAWPTCIPAVFPHSFWFLFIRNLPKIGWFLRERFVCWRRLWLCNAASTRGGERCDVYGFSWKSCFRFLFQRALLFFFYFPKHNLKNLPSVNALVMLLPQSKKKPTVLLKHIAVPDKCLPPATKFGEFSFSFMAVAVPRNSTMMLRKASKSPSLQNTGVLSSCRSRFSLPAILTRVERCCVCNTRK